MADVCTTQSAFLSHFFVGPPNKIPKLANFQQEVSLETPNERIVKELSDLQRSEAKLAREIEVLRRNLAAAKKLNHELQNELKKERKPFFNSKKSFSDLNSKTKSHKKQRVKIWLKKQFKKLPSEWKVREMHVFIDNEFQRLDNFGVDDEEEEEEEEENPDITLRIQKALKAKDDGDISDGIDPATVKPTLDLQAAP
ncbi:hypothetical protein AC249_AIPGENE4164 [Exaiptasia diaphana]|nr:hypothetical protein AC249_AIPGENE4164 [Exaiptasia diaphana]